MASITLEEFLGDEFDVNNRVYSGRTKYSAPAYHLRYNAKKTYSRIFVWKD